MSSITGLRAAIATALEGLTYTPGTVNVFTWPAPAPDMPAAVVGDDDPLIAQRDEDDGGYTLRVIRFRVLLMVPDRLGAEGYALLETWADQMDDLMAAVVPPAGMTKPAVTSVSARGLVPYAETTALGQFFDIEVSDQFC